MELQFYIAWSQKISSIRLHFSRNFEKRKNKPGKQKVIPSRAKSKFKNSKGRTGFPADSVVKNPPARQETWVRPLGWEDPGSEEMPTHFGILAWEIPWTEQPSRLCSPWGPKRVRHSLATGPTEGEEQEMGLFTELQRSWQMWLR